MLPDPIYVLALCLREADGQTLTTLEGRVAFQKRVYMLQQLGLDLKYQFSWDVYGPYSRQLAEDAHVYELNREDVDARIASLRLNEQTERTVGQLKAMVAENPGLSEAAWLELLASSHYLIHAPRLVAPGAGEDDVWQELVSRKPHFRENRDALSTALAVLKEHGLDH